MSSMGPSLASCSLPRLTWRIRRAAVRRVRPGGAAQRVAMRRGGWRCGVCGPGGGGAARRVAVRRAGWRAGRGRRSWHNLRPRTLTARRRPLVVTKAPDSAPNPAPGAISAARVHFFGHNCPRAQVLPRASTSSATTVPGRKFCRGAEESGKERPPPTRTTSCRRPFVSLAPPGRAIRTPVRYHQRGNPVQNLPRRHGQGAHSPSTTTTRPWMIGPRTWNWHGRLQTTTSSARTGRATTTSCVWGLTLEPSKRIVGRVERSPEQPFLTLPPAPLRCRRAAPRTTRRTRRQETCGSYRGNHPER